MRVQRALQTFDPRETGLRAVAVLFIRSAMPAGIRKALYSLQMPGEHNSSAAGSCILTSATNPRQMAEKLWMCT